VAAADLPELQRAIRATQGMFSGGFNSDGGDDDPGIPGMSVRDAAAEALLRGMRAAREEETAGQIALWSMDDLCWHLRASGATAPLQPDDERAATRSQRAAFDNDQRPGASQCRGQLSLQDLDARASAGWFARETLAKDDRLHLQSSWAQWYAGQPDAALSEAMAYVAAARTSGKLDGDDVALAISLHIRAGKPVPAVLNDTFVLPPDAPWPAPLLAWQRGTLNDAALFAIIDSYAPSVAALARNDAWFHVGVRRWSGKDAPGAAAAFRWYDVDGVRGSLSYVLAGLERQAAASRDPDLVAGKRLAAGGKHTEAVAAWRKAAARGDVEAQALLGVALATGRGVEKDPAAAHALLAPAAGAGSGMAAYQLAFFEPHDRPGSKARGIAFLQQAVALGYPRAMFHVSSLYRRGLVMPPDAARGVELERQAAELGDPTAQGVHAFSYLRGTGVARNDALARYWAKRAIVSGNDDGYAVLASLLMRGSADDQRAALDMVRNLAQAGNHMAMVVMGHAAMRGLGQPADLAAARRWYVKVQQQGGSKTLAELGDVLGLWEGDADSAFDVLQLAAADGDAEAQTGLARSYRRGAGTPVDQVQSVRWLRVAARQGNLNAINNLGDAYETGAGVPVDLVQALTLYRQAAQQGGPAAFASLASINENGVGTRPDLRLAYTYRLLRQRFIEAADPGAEVDSATLAMAARLSVPDQAHARAAALAWQPGQPLPGQAAGD